LRSSGRSSGFKVIIHGPAQEYLRALERLDRDDAVACADTLAALGRDPFRPRPGVDVKRWDGPEFDYCLCTRRHTFGYRVDKKKRVVHVIDTWFR
jgi:hypothetical protein